MTRVGSQRHSKKKKKNLSQYHFVLQNLKSAPLESKSDMLGKNPEANPLTTCSPASVSLRTVLKIPFGRRRKFSFLYTEKVVSVVKKNSHNMIKWSQKL